MTYDNIKVGDKVRYTGDSKSDLTHGKVYEVVASEELGFDVLDDVGDKNCIVSESYEPVTDGTDTPTIWRDMTDAEKGALLLAHHEGKVIEWIDPYSVGDEWDTHFFAIGDPDFAYRIKPEPYVEPKKPREVWAIYDEDGDYVATRLTENSANIYAGMKLGCNGAVIRMIEAED